MNFDEARDLLWIVVGLYGLAFFFGFLKTFKVNWSPIKGGTLGMHYFGFCSAYEGLVFKDWKYTGAPWVMEWSAFSLFFGH